jgi:murein DD-endopeptidase / murein LD-carboxypeptidase
MLNKYRLIFFAIVLLTFLASCGSSHGAKRSTAEENLAASSAEAKARKIFATEYSKKLGIAVPEMSNQLLITTIADWMGVPYKFGGNDRKGVDCSGFINNVFPAVYQLKVPRVTAQIQKQAEPVPRKNLQEGDLVFFKINTKEVGHAGIYLFDNYFVHASTSRGVMISRLEETYWNKYFVGGGRISR